MYFALPARNLMLRIVAVESEQEIGLLAFANKDDRTPVVFSPHV